MATNPKKELLAINNTPTHLNPMGLSERNRFLRQFRVTSKIRGWGDDRLDFREK